MSLFGKSGKDNVFFLVFLIVFIFAFSLLPVDVWCAYKYKWLFDNMLQEQYDDNINLSSYNEESDWITTVSPGISFSAGSAESGLNLLYHANVVFYKNQPHNNFTGHASTVTAFTHIGKRIVLRFSDALNRSDEPREVSLMKDGELVVSEEVEPTSYVIGTRTERSIYIRNIMEMSAEYAYGKKGFLRVGYTNNMLDNEEETLQDSREHIFKFEIFHNLDKRNTIDIKYNHQVSWFDTSSDFRGDEIALTFSRKFSAWISASLGYSLVTRNFDDGSQDYKTQTVNGTFDYSPNPFLSISVDAGYFIKNPDKGTNETGFDGGVSLNKRWKHMQNALRLSVGYAESYVDAENLGFTKYWSIADYIDYEFSKRISFSFDGSFRNDDFASGRSQDTWTGKLATSYFFSKSVSCNIEYLYQKRSASTKGLDYEDNRITFVIKAVF